MLEKAYIMYVDYKTTVEATVQLENIVVRNGKNHSHNKVSWNYLGSSTQVDYNLRRSQYSHVFFILLSRFSCRKFEKTLVTCNV